MPELPELAYKEYHTDKPDSILFLHGGGVAGWMWEPVVDLLPEFHCIVPDLPEHGASAAVSPFSMVLAAEKCAKLVQRHGHGGKAVVVGLSEGAQVAVQMLASTPECVTRAMISSALLLPIPGSKNYSNPKLLAAMYRWSMSPGFQKNWWIRLNMKYSAGIPNEFFPLFKENFIGMTRNQFVNLMVANQTFRLPQGVENYTCAGADRLRQARIQSDARIRPSAGAQPAKYPPVYRGPPPQQHHGAGAQLGAHLTAAFC